MPQSQRSFRMAVYACIKNGTLISQLTDPVFAESFLNDPMLIQHAIYTIFKMKEHNPGEGEAMLENLLDFDSNLTRMRERPFLFSDVQQRGICTALHLALMDNQSSKMIQGLIEFGFIPDEFFPVSSLLFGLDEAKSSFISKKIDTLFPKRKVTKLNVNLLALILERQDLFECGLLNFHKNLKLLAEIYENTKSENVKNCIDLILFKMSDLQKAEIFDNNHLMLVSRANVYLKLGFYNQGKPPREYCQSGLSNYGDAPNAIYPAISLYNNNFSIHTSFMENSKETNPLRGHISLNFLENLNAKMKVVGIRSEALITTEMLSLLKSQGLDEDLILEMNERSKNSVGLSLIIENHQHFIELCLKHKILTPNSRLPFGDKKFPPLAFAFKYGTLNLANLFIASMNQIRSADLDISSFESKGIIQYRRHFQTLLSSEKLDDFLKNIIEADLQVQEKEASEAAAREAEAKRLELERLEKEAAEAAARKAEAERLELERLEKAQAKKEAERQAQLAKKINEPIAFPRDEPSLSTIPSENRAEMVFKYGQGYPELPSQSSKSQPLLNKDKKREKIFGFF